MQQSKLESMIEVFFNYLSGFIIAYLTYSYVIMPIEWLKDSPFWVTTIFTGVSIVRTYFWRRIFNARLHKLIYTTLEIGT